MYLSWFCLYGRVYREAYAECMVACWVCNDIVYALLVLQKSNALSCRPCWLCIWLVVGFMGNFQSAVVLSFPPNNTKLSL